MNHYQRITINYVNFGHFTSCITVLQDCLGQLKQRLMVDGASAWDMLTLHLEGKRQDITFPSPNYQLG